MDKAGVAFAIPVIVFGIVSLVFAVRMKSETRLFAVVAGLAAVSVGIVKVLMYAGRMDSEGAVYWTLNISLSTLFFVMMLLALYSAKRKRENVSTS